MDKYVWIVYPTDGYTCGEVQAVFPDELSAKIYAELNCMSGIKKMKIRNKITHLTDDCYR